MPVSRAEILNLLTQSHLFHGMDESQLALLIDRFNGFEYEAGKTIYDSHAPAKYFYFILNGQIRIDMAVESGVMQHSILHAGDFFGEDALAFENQRKSSAIAEKKSIVLRITQADLINLQAEHPNLENGFKMAYQVYLMKFKRKPTWTKSSESIYYLNHPYPFFALIKSLLPFLVTMPFLLNAVSKVIAGNGLSNRISALNAFAVIVGISWAVWNLIDWSNDFHIITNQRVVVLDKVVMLYESRQETPLAAILSITKQTGILGRFFDFADISIRTYTGVLNLKHVHFPDQVIHLLEEHWARTKKNLNQDDVEEMEELLRMHFFDGDQHEENKAEINYPGSVQIKNGWFTKTLAALFGMRNEADGVITYRTHWLILLKKTYMPGCLFLILVSLSILFVNKNLGFIPQELFYLFLITSGMIVAFWWVYLFVDWRNDLYVITHDSVIDINRKPLGLEDKRTAPLKNVQSIEYKRTGLLGLLLNYGTVFIRVGDTQLTFDFVHNPSNVQRELFDRYSEVIKKDKEIQTDRERRRMVDWMEAYHRIVVEEEELDDGLPGI